MAMSRVVRRNKAIVRERGRLRDGGMQEGKYARGKNLSVPYSLLFVL